MSPAAIEVGLPEATSRPISPNSRRESTRRESIGGELWRTLTRKSTYSQKDERDHYDIGGTDEKPFAPDVKEWALAGEVREFEAEREKTGLKHRKLGVTWNNLTVKGIGADTAIHENVLSNFNVLQKIKESRQPKHLRTILDSSHGCVKPGEMLLVLGRPGAGCTTLLKLLANKRAGFAEVSGDIHWGSLDHKQAEQHRGQIVMNREDEVFFPSLTVGQTMDFATRMKVPTKRTPGQSVQDYQSHNKDFLLRSMGIDHTNDTKVGNEYIRGVSGGERKRVSIVEVLATNASVLCWDNSTRGLDASTALEWTRAIRTMTDTLGVSTIATLYQAGNGIYNLFDKVLVLDEGKQIYYGTREEARPFMEKLGFICSEGSNIGDFLTGTTVPTERAIRPGFEGKFPRTADQIRERYQNSPICATMQQETDYHKSAEAEHNTAEFKLAVAEEKSPSLPKKSPLTIPLPAQILTAIVRQYQILLGDVVSLVIKQLLVLFIALISGSLFYDAQDDSTGLFVKSGAIFTSLLIFGLMAMSEVTDSFSGRPVLAKHKEFAYYHPAAFCIAQIVADIPVIAFQVSVWSLILYFMVGLTTSASAFFTFWIVLFSISIVMTALFRLCGSCFDTFDNASKVSGLLVSALVMYNGYMIPKNKMHPWFVWIYWINPLAYAFESLMGNEYKDKVITCAANNLVPGGPSYQDRTFAACAGVGGAQPGADFVTGEQYLNSLSYSSSRIWRNFGIIWCWWALFVALTIFFTNKWQNVGSGGVLLVPRENKDKITSKKSVSDEESQVNQEKVASSGSSETSGTLNNTHVESDLVRNTSIFTWKNLTYTVDTPSGKRTLLDSVDGWIKPGSLGCLMGSSGAGKTTLMDVLASRKTEGTIKGSIMVDGRPLPLSFQRSAGYCEQLDVHEPYATVREALEFSALLRQPRDVAQEDKLKYVDTVIDLLELHDLEHNLIGLPGAGLSIEQRKRVTIGVELVAKPSILIFLDEPTSGLDGQAAFNTLRFLKKLAAAGQAVLCTIHQPSAQLFAQFDSLLLLARGGKTVYFGDIGKDAETIKDYFARNDAPCPPSANPAEHMIDVVSGSLSKGKDWNQVWLNSPERRKMTDELDFLIQDAASKPPGTTDDGHEFATDLWTQTKIVTQRMNVSLYRNVEYVSNKIALHIFSALFNGFSFWMIGDSVNDLQLSLFAVFNVLFVAPGVMAQLQPLFIARRDIYDAREKKSKMYSWQAFVTGLIVSEVPYLVICAVLYYVCFYYQTGFPVSSDKAGAVFFIIFIYEFIYTGIGQFVAAYAPNAVSASLINPLIISMLVSFCGVLVPYGQIQEFWRYWMYWVNPFTYLMGGFLTFTVFDKQVLCAESEFAIFDTPSGQTCASYLADYLQGMGMHANLTNPEATGQCRVCQYSRGSDYLQTVNINDYYYGWRDIGICVIFAISGYALVYGLMKLRTKASKKAE
ncbi:Brefeldin A resistance protein [Elsinoe australis]|uniref:Brefeldin A resistance protein n=1 Tax=Elsinoe australis TaxID=40998 RepID=A0A2P7YR85_9PEZI|nr:Brefeldin A resistance protein [Elsinoe australis]